MGGVQPSFAERAMLIVAVYHYVRPRFDHPFPGIHGVTPVELEAQLQLLGQVGDFVTISQLADAADGVASLPPRALLVTFDDGLREQVDHAVPVLDRLGIPAAFFVSTWPIAKGGVATAHQIHLLRAYTPPAEFCALLDTEARWRGLRMRLDTEPAQAAANYPWDPPESAQLKYFLNHQLAPDVSEDLIASCFRQVFGEAEAALSRELYMDVGQLKTLGARGYLGTHGDRHLPLGRLSRRAACHDVRKSLDQLAD